MAISFHLEGVRYQFTRKRALKAWIKASAFHEMKVVGEINIILCSDDRLLEMNNQFLEHDYFTDIITFNYNNKNTISGDLFISIDRVKDNAIKNNVPTETELQRVIIHGVMHLCGYNDKSKTEQSTMRNKEEEHLKKWLKFVK